MKLRNVFVANISRTIARKLDAHLTLILNQSEEIVIACSLREEMKTNLVLRTKIKRRNSRVIVNYALL